MNICLSVYKELTVRTRSYNVCLSVYKELTVRNRSYNVCLSVWYYLVKVYDLWENHIVTKSSIMVSSEYTCTKSKRL
jgi:hypothetical protein